MGTQASASDTGRDSSPALPPCPYLPEPPLALDYRCLRRHRAERGNAFYLDALGYAQTLWRRRLPARALLALTRGLYADLSVPLPWPLPYSALVWIMRQAPADGFLGNPRVSYQHQAVRLRGPRQRLRRGRAAACWHLARATRPDLPGDPRCDAEPPDRDRVAAVLLELGLPGEAAAWQTALEEAASREAIPQLPP